MIAGKYEHNLMLLREWDNADKEPQSSGHYEMDGAQGDGAKLGERDIAISKKRNAEKYEPTRQRYVVRNESSVLLLTEMANMCFS